MDRFKAGYIILTLILICVFGFVFSLFLSTPAAAQEGGQINISTNESGDNLPDSIVKELGDGVIVKEVIEEENQFKVVIEVKRDESVTLTKGWLIDAPWITEEDRITLSKGNHTVIMEKRPSEGMAIINEEEKKALELEGQIDWYNEDTDPLHSALVTGGGITLMLAVLIGKKYREKLKTEKRIL